MPTSSLTQCFASFCVLGLIGNQTQAANIYWDGSGTSWNSVASWSTAAGAVLPNPSVVPGSGDTAVFNSTNVNTAQTVNLNAAQSASGLSFVSSGTVLLQGGGTNRVLTLGGEGITKSGIGVATIGSVTSGQQVSLALGADQSWTNNNNTGALVIRNGVSASTATARTLTLNGTSTAANTVGGIIANNSTGVMTLDKSGDGTWILSGANSYTGVTSVSAGVLSIRNSTGLGTTAGGTSVTSGAALQIQGGIAIGTEALALSGMGVGNTGGALRSVSGNNSYAGAITFGADSAIGVDAGSLSLAGGINSASHQFYKVGNGILILDSADQLTGIHNITAGTLQLGASGSIQAVSMVISLGATFDLNDQSTTLGTVSLTGGSITTGEGILSLLSDSTVSTLASGTSSLISGNLDLSGSTQIFNVADGGATEDLQISAIVSSATGSLTKTGAGTLALSNANTYEGATNINAGTLSWPSHQ